MDQNGGYDVEFVDRISDHLICVICHLALRDPVFFVPCGHKLCNCCYKVLKEDATQRNIDLLCPYDRSKVDVNQVVEDVGTSRMILDMKVKCKHGSDGCEWTGDLCNLEVHLTRGCKFEEKEKTIKLLQDVQNRLEVCETRLEENQIELEALKLDNHRKGDEIVLMKEQISSKDNDIALMKERISSKDNDIVLKKEKVSSFETHRLKICETRLQGNEKELLTLRADIQQKGDDIVMLKQHIYSKHNEEKRMTPSERNQIAYMEQRISSLEQKMDDDDDDDSDDDDNEVVFKWNLANYNDYKEIGEAYSTQFYSHENDCCMLGLDWYGNKKGRLGLFFYIVVDDNDGDFRYNVTLEMRGKGNAYESFDIDYSEFSGNPDCYGIPDGNLSICLGNNHFLNMPRLRRFVISNSLFITCKLTPKDDDF